MNRHERRAAKARARTSAQTDRGFEAYCAQARRADPTIDDKKLGEGWMRGQVWAAMGADAMIVHRPGETSVRRDDDIVVSATYGQLKFKAYVSKILLHEGIKRWQEFIADFAKHNNLQDPRAASRIFILRVLAEQSHTQGDTAAGTAAAIAWLASTTPPVIPLFKDGGSPPRIHYEITDISDDAGPGQNFRLILSKTDEPLPEWVKAVSPPSPNSDEGNPASC